MLILTGVPALIVDRSAGSEIPLLVGLFILFVTKERRQDERAIMIKTSSATLALILSYGFKLLTSNLYSHRIISFQLVDINYFLILVFALAVVIYYVRMYIILK